MKMLVLADIHGYEKELSEILDKKFTDIDIIVCIGDLIDMFRIPEGYTQIDMCNMILQKLLALNKPLICIPGNHDPEEVVDLFNEYSVNLHDKMKRFRGVVFLGFGGAETPFNTFISPPI